MTTTIVIDGASYSYSDGDWEKLIGGQMDAPYNVLRYIIQRHGANYTQVLDELSYYQDLLETVTEDRDTLHMQVVDLKRRLIDEGESKPARNKRKKKEEVDG